MEKHASTIAALTEILGKEGFQIFECLQFWIP